MTKRLLGLWLGAGMLPCALLSAQPLAWSAAGALVEVSISIDGSPAPLYPARDGSGRHYLEAREGRAYQLQIANRSGERLGVVLSVDGLNAVSGERDRSSGRPGGPGRMYVLSPFESTSVRGWRTSLDDIHRFTFVDERSSYAVRAGKANGRMGWIEVAVFREQQPRVRKDVAPIAPNPPAYPLRERRARDEAQAAPPAQELPAERGQLDANQSQPAPSAPRAYPGTGWGQREADRAVLVDFRPGPLPAERVTLRYEYRAALQALGLLPRFASGRDRLAERERGQGGFVAPPAR